MKRQTPVLLAISLAVLMVAARGDEYEETTVARVGDKAPTFTCETIDGERFSIKEHAGKVVFINFFATWCGPCLAELPELEKSIHEVFKDEADFKLMVIGREHTAPELKDFRMQKGLDLPMAPDPDRSIYSLYATKFIPRNILIGRDGTVKFSEVGFSEEKLKTLVTLIKQELAIKPDESAPAPVRKAA